MKYVSQVENQVSNIFVMNEGILIEFTIQQMPTFQEIKDRTLFVVENRESISVKPRSRLI